MERFGRESVDRRNVSLWKKVKAVVQRECVHEDGSARVRMCCSARGGREEEEGRLSLDKLA